MKTVAVICEYNPFHFGHLYQLEQIKQRFGDDTRIVAIMSGNYVQRGDVAIADKFARAKTAVLCGASLVIELPFPYSLASSEFFARAGVTVADRLGVIDHLCFGSMSSNTEELARLEGILSSEEFSRLFEERKSSDDFIKIGHAALSELICREISSDKCIELLRSPNDILGVEYLRSLRVLGSDITPIPIPLADSKDCNGYTSATEVRIEIASGGFSSNLLPSSSGNVISSEIAAGNSPCDLNRLSAAILTFLIRSEDGGLDKYYNCGGGLANRLRRMAESAYDVSSLISLTATKRYTDSHIRRAILCSFIGVTSSDVSAPPEFTQVLAMDGIGRSLLREIKKNGKLEILTKPADFDHLSERARAQAELQNRADSIRNLTLPSPRAPGDIFRQTPYCEF